jgi:NADPH:quinone reductase-like Zn-dependent oxidoreductase
MKAIVCTKYGPPEVLQLQEVEKPTPKQAAKSSNITYEEAAAIPYGGLLALHFLRQGQIQSRQHVLIYGASGAVGTAAVQLARSFGATVTGVCSSTHVALVQSLGAEHVLDYTKEERTPSGAHYDLIFDAVGKAKSSPLKVQCKEALTPNGTSLSVDEGRPEVRTEGLRFLKRLSHFLTKRRERPRQPASSCCVQSGCCRAKQRRAARSAIH